MDSKIVGNVFLSLGSNLGDRSINLQTALSRISAECGPLTASSVVYETAPWGFKPDSDFLNLAVAIETELKPEMLLDALLNIEKSMGRIRGKKGYESRIIDIDILFYSDLIIENQRLVIPHPHLHKRRFVLVPLADIAPEFIHPVLKKSILSLLESCPDTSDVHKS
jgi:2-amino-4-hydroxy-6-hydroxymethyldihydropteridine diphosphokinase